MGLVYYLISVGMLYVVLPLFDVHEDVLGWSIFLAIPLAFVIGGLWRYFNPVKEESYQVRAARKKIESLESTNELREMEIPMLKLRLTQLKRILDDDELDARQSASDTAFHTEWGLRQTAANIDDIFKRSELIKSYDKSLDKLSLELGESADFEKSRKALRQGVWNRLDVDKINSDTLDELRKREIVDEGLFNRISERLRAKQAKERKAKNDLIDEIEECRTQLSNLVTIKKEKKF